MKRWMIGGAVALILLPLAAAGAFIFSPSPVAFEDVRASDASDCFTSSAVQNPRDVWQRTKTQVLAEVGAVHCKNAGVEALGTCLASKEIDSDVRSLIEEKLSTAKETLASGRQSQSMKHVLAAAELAIDHDEEHVAYLLFNTYFENSIETTCASDGPQCFEEATILAKLLYSVRRYNDARGVLEFALLQTSWGDWTPAKILDHYYLLELESDNQLEAAGFLFRTARQYQVLGDARTAADRYAVFAFRVLQIGAAIPKEQRDCVENARKIGLLRSDTLYTSLMSENSIVETFDMLILRAGVRRAQSR